MHVAQLVREARTGDPDAREALARHWLPIVYGTALAITKRAADAEDLTQEAFYRAFARLHQLRAQSRFGPWLLRIVRNAARDQARRKRPEVGAPVWDPPARETSEPGENPALDAWRDLPEQQRLVCWLSVMQDLPVREIASLIGMSKSSVARALNKGLTHMRKELGHVEA